MPNTTIKQWAEAHGSSAARVGKRIERFAGNTSDPDTHDAAQELVEMIQSALPKEKTE